MVDGFVYSGKVSVIYNQGSDTFSVVIGDLTFDDVYVDELVSFIDGKVENDCGAIEYMNRIENWLQSDEFNGTFNSEIEE